MRTRGWIGGTCRVILGLYPSGWRARYGAELEDVLDQHQITVRTVVDLALGAVDAYRHPELGPAEVLPPSERLRSGFGSMLLASVVFGLAWVAILSVRLRAVPGRASDLQNHPDLGLAIALVQVAGAISLLAIMAGAVASVAAVSVGQGRQPRRLAPSIGVALLASTAFIGLGRAAGAGMENRGNSGLLLLLAVLAWAVGAAVLMRMIEHGAPDQAHFRLGMRLGRLGVLGMAVTVAGSIWLGTAVSLEVPTMGAEVVPILPMAIAAAWAASALRRASRAGESHKLLA